MKKPIPKMSNLVVSAIRNLREARGSTSKDIMNYIMTEHHSGDAVIQRQVMCQLHDFWDQYDYWDIYLILTICKSEISMNAALKRGVDYGILKRVNGHYSLNGEPFCINPQNLVPEDKGKRRKRRVKKSGSRKRGGRRGRRGKGHTRARKSSMKTQRRGILKRKRGIHVKRVRGRPDHVNESYREEPRPIERNRTEHGKTEHRPADVEVPRRGSSIKSKERERSCSKSRRSQSQPRHQSRPESQTRSHNRSSGSSDREYQNDDHQDDNRNDD